MYKCCQLGQQLSPWCRGRSIEFMTPKMSMSIGEEYPRHAPVRALPGNSRSVDFDAVLVDQFDGLPSD
jgi:hypothetical protein